jgi:hypothetical protein
VRGQRGGAGRGGAGRRTNGPAALRFTTALHPQAGPQGLARRKADRGDDVLDRNFTDTIKADNAAC